MKNIPFNIPPATGREPEYLAKAIANHKLCGDGPFTKQCHQWLEERTGAPKALLTTSGTSALEMAALLCDVQPGDEVILPSFTFVSTADAFVQRGAKVVYVDIRPDTMNIDETKIEAAITDKTTCICVVHYAGVACEMDTIMDIARRHHLKVVEDAAQGVMSSYKGRALGTIGDVGCYSFHETKNYTMGEGGAVLVNHPEDIERAEIIREKGTNRSKFLRGQIDKYTWVDYGSSYLPSDLNAAYLLPQLEEADKTEVNNKVAALANQVFCSVRALSTFGNLVLPNDLAVAHAKLLCSSLDAVDMRSSVAFRLVANRDNANLQVAGSCIGSSGSVSGRICCCAGCSSAAAGGHAEQHSCGQHNTQQFFHV